MNNIYSIAEHAFKYKTILLISLLLGSCNAGPELASNGLGGTGITQGRVTAFGSMFVNGIKFNTDNATFIRDGIGSKTQDDFSTGEIVTIKGIVNPDNKTGIAEEVSFSDVLEGEVTAIHSGNSIEVLGQNVLTDNLTVFTGINKLSDLGIGNIVEISGFMGENGVTASSIKLISTDYTDGIVQEAEGFIKNLDTAAQTFRLNNLTINYSAAQFDNISESELENDLYLIISTEQAITNNLLNASNISLFDDKLEAGVFYEIEGYISQFNSSNSFEIDGDPVISNEQTKFVDGVAADLALDTHIIITGSVNSQNILVADTVKLLDNSSSTTIEATIDSLDLGSNSLVILGKTIAVTNFTLLSDETTEDFLTLNLNDFSAGDPVFISVRTSEGKLIAERLSKISPVETVFIEGKVEDVDANLKTITLFGNTIKVDDNTSFFDANTQLIAENIYFSALKRKTTMIQVRGTKINTHEILANELILGTSD